MEVANSGYLPPLATDTEVNNNFSMMILNSFTAANDYNFGAQSPNGRLVFLSTNKIFEGICIALAGKFFKSSCEFFLYLKPFYKKTIKISFKLNLGLQNGRPFCL